MNDCVINYKYKIVDKIGGGKFGSIYKAVHQKTNAVVAIKFENSNDAIKLLQHETTILNYLRSEGIKTVPTVFWYGLYGENLCTVMTLFDFSLLQYCHLRTLSRVTIYSIISKCLSILESVHDKCIIHRDIKPENIMMKDGEPYLIDFGLSTFYVNDRKQHIRDEKTVSSMTGTPKWVSYNIHRGSQPSRRDDLISLCYIFLFMIDGQLPWENIIDRSPEERAIIRRELKSLENITGVTDDPVFLQFVKYCYEIAYDQEPDYYRLNVIFKNNIKK